MQNIDDYDIALEYYESIGEPDNVPYNKLHLCAQLNILNVENEALSYYINNSENQFSEDYIDLDKVIKLAKNGKDVSEVLLAQDTIQAKENLKFLEHGMDRQRTSLFRQICNTEYAGLDSFQNVAKLIESSLISDTFIKTVVNIAEVDFNGNEIEFYNKIENLLEVENLALLLNKSFGDDKYPVKLNERFTIIGIDGKENIGYIECVDVDSKQTKSYVPINENSSLGQNLLKIKEALVNNKPLTENTKMILASELDQHIPKTLISNHTPNKLSVERNKINF